LTAVLISAIIPAYNSAETIKDALDSVVAQTMWKQTGKWKAESEQAQWATGDFPPSYEIIVIDDASRDNTQQVVDFWIKEQRAKQDLSCFTFKLLHFERNSGPAAARNKGIAAACGEWLAFLDADDTWLPNKLAIQMDMVAKHPDVAMWCGGIAVHGNSAKWQAESGKSQVASGKRQEQGLSSAALTSSPLTPYPLPLASFALGNPVATSTGLVKKDAVLAVGGFDEQFRGPEDYDLWMRIAARCSIMKIEIPLVQYNQRSGSLSMDDRTFLPQVVKVLDKAFGEHGVLMDRPDLRDAALSSQLWNASWMAFNRGQRFLAIRYWSRSYGLNWKSGKHVKRKWFSLLARYLLGEDAGAKR
jgi:glycosyltransferase involved in cell wall biosynthesis